MTVTNGVIYPAENMHIKNIKSGEVYPGYIAPAKSLSQSDFVEVDEAEYQAYISASEQITDTEALEIITGGTT